MRGIYGWTPNEQGRLDEITNTWRDVKRGELHLNSFVAIDFLLTMNPISNFDCR